MEEIFHYSFFPFLSEFVFAMAVSFRQVSHFKNIYSYNRVRQVFRTGVQDQRPLISDVNLIEL